ncbi:hypothetical protein DASC09_000990 [Saccharomycopsis crataegensis]|uniref:Uncharacterized protein n=1 Tax=Saccharomycopsis crataegensis TaxID=43959 RepID=A0AAV5QEK8_9ASCO|nr:hypothetical protein DASC09_000990 [Saccharomycopsis crataegensis]
MSQLPVDYEADTRHMVHDFEDEDEDDEEFNFKFNRDMDNEIVTNATETLKSVFNPEDDKDEETRDEESAGGFAFNLADSDIEDIEPVEEEIVLRASIVADVEEQETEVEPQIKLKALFFPHFDSPFLVAQTQLNKLISYNPMNNSNYESIVNWKKDFNDNRVELMKGFKRRKRDVIRHNTKR